MTYDQGLGDIQLYCEHYCQLLGPAYRSADDEEHHH